MGPEVWDALEDPSDADAEWLGPELELLRRLRELLRDVRPRQLAKVRSKWDDRLIMQVRFEHADGVTALKLFYGDGYTGLEAPHLLYGGWLRPEILAAVVRAAMTGSLVAVEEYRLGRLLGTEYMVEREDGTVFIIRSQWSIRERVGRRPSRVRALLRPVPWARRVKRVSLSLDRTPAVLPLS